MIFYQVQYYEAYGWKVESQWNEFTAALNQQDEFMKTAKQGTISRIVKVEVLLKCTHSGRFAP